MESSRPFQTLTLRESVRENGVIGIDVNYYEYHELAQCIEAGAKQLGLQDKVWLTGTFGKIETNEKFNYTTEGYNKAVEYLIEIGKWDELKDSGFSTDGYSIVFEANSLFNKENGPNQ